MRNRAGLIFSGRWKWGKRNAKCYRIVQRVSELAEARDLPMAQIALAWELSKPVVTSAIIGATKPHDLEDAIAVLSVQLAPEEMQQLEEAYQPSHRYPLASQNSLSKSAF